MAREAGSRGQGRSGAALAAAGLLLSLGAAAAAHGPVELRLAELGRVIAREPARPGPHLERADLHRASGRIELALDDLARAEACGAAPADVAWRRGRALLDAQRPAEALAPLEAAVASRPDDVASRELLGRALAALGRSGEAAAAFTRAIALEQAPSPDLFLMRAAAVAAAGAGESGASLERALEGLDEGIVRLGPLVSLEEAAIHLELRLGRSEGALARLDTIARQSSRSDPWLVRRAEILAQAGRSRAAREAFLAAREAWSALPPARRETRASAALAARIERGLAALPASSEGAP